MSAKCQLRTFSVYAWMIFSDCAQLPSHESTLTRRACRYGLRRLFFLGRPARKAAHTERMVQATIRGEPLMQAYLLFMAIALVPVGLLYGIDPAGVLPRFLDVRVEGADQNQIFRALMCLLLGASTFWAVAAFKPDW